MSGYSGPVCDACVFHEWPSVAALGPYLPGGWSDVLLQPNTRVVASKLYRDPRGSKSRDAMPVDGPAGSDPGLLLSQLGAGSRRDRLVLGYDTTLYSTANPNYYIARAVAQAANDWTEAEWLAHDDRFCALITVAAAIPESAAAEIRRVGINDRFVGIALGANALNQSFGHPVYHPIYEAAAELDLPVVLQIGPSDAFGDAPSSPIAGGHASTNAEFRALAWQSHMVHVSSMIMGGLFNVFPNLKVILVGGGATWITGQLLKLDYWFRMVTREARWLDRLPSEYFADHVRVVTYGLEQPSRPELLERALTTIPDIERVLMYGSGYPNADWEEPNALAARLPEAWHDGVFCGNARTSFRWPTADMVGVESRVEKGVVS